MSKEEGVRLSHTSVHPASQESSPITPQEPDPITSGSWLRHIPTYTILISILGHIIVLIGLSYILPPFDFGDPFGTDSVEVTVIENASDFRLVPR